MDKKKFDKIMDEWAAHEMEAVPELKPSSEVYQKLEEKKKKPRFVLFSWPVRLAAAGIAAALIILVIVIQPPKEVEPFLGLRKGTVKEVSGEVEIEDRMEVLGEAEAEEQEKDIVEPEKVERKEVAKIQERIEEGIKKEEVEKTEFEEPPAKKKIRDKLVEVKVADKEALAKPKEVSARLRMEVAAAAPAATQIMPERMEFQYQPKGSDAIEMLDIDSPQDEITSLSSEDNYRLILQLPQERYVYVFQVGAEEQIVRLFPNTDYNSEQNPIQAGNTVIIPLPPNWFYVEKDVGEVLIYVVTSAEQLHTWDELYAEFSQTSKTEQKQKISTRLLNQIEQNKQKLEEKVSVRVFRFNIHDKNIT
ncbi:MAG: DUF4384 domain-containing protein [Candidatus Aminicenantes bacterium]|nr:MAG: DUF4384 domain-containing protein [Candidatus Aminicenantes bacterium]